MFFLGVPQGRCTTQPCEALASLTRRPRTILTWVTVTSSAKPGCGDAFLACGLLPFSCHFKRDVLTDTQRDVSVPGHWHLSWKWQHLLCLPTSECAQRGRLWQAGVNVSQSGVGAPFRELSISADTLDLVQSVFQLCDAGTVKRRDPVAEEHLWLLDS